MCDLTSREETLRTQDLNGVQFDKILMELLWTEVTQKEVEKRYGSTNTTLNILMSIQSSMLGDRKDSNKDKDLKEKINYYLKKK